MHAPGLRQSKESAHSLKVDSDDLNPASRQNLGMDLGHLDPHLKTLSDKNIEMVSQTVGNGSG